MRPQVLLLTVALGTQATVHAGESTAIDFNRDIRPLFASKCFACHGPDESHREADLRLDVRQDAIDYGAIVPNAADESAFIDRIQSDDPDLVMPPPHTGDTLTDEQKQRFAAWVNQGAPYAKHWSFVPPSRPQPPAVSDESWPRNAIDRFVLARLDAERLSPSPEADRLTLLRRVSLDLIGLPPTVEEADAFLRDDAPGGYGRLVDRLLDSPRYGERWARPWLDLARYSDTNGYEKDRPRSIWPYRDWVIRALNNDMPYDEFTIEQLAGDMLPEASQSQRIATGFHRNTMLNEEGGIDPLEYRFYAMVDRVATTGTVWLGLSTGCAQCHTHKYDPITHTDYYSLMALLNNADEPDLTVRSNDVHRKREAIAETIRELEENLPNQFPPAAGNGPIAERRRQHLETKFAAWLRELRPRAREWTTLPLTTWTTNLPRLETLGDGSILSTGDVTKRDEFKLTFQIDESRLPVTAIRLEVLPDERLPGGGPGRSFYEGRKGDFFLSELSFAVDGQPIGVNEASHSFGKIAVGRGTAEASNVFDGKGSTGWSTATREGERHQLVVNLAEPITQAGLLDVTMLFERHFAASLGRFRFSSTSASERSEANDWPVDVEALLTAADAATDETTGQTLLNYYMSVAPELAAARKPIERLRDEQPDNPSTMVLTERPMDNPRVTNRHHRGEFLSPKEEVPPAIPAFLAAESSALPTNRLELARWLVSDDNPLAARVAANRAWQAFFGQGLQRTSDDFGTQAEPPTHPELLDWLACELADGGWSMKSLHRTIVMSATYRQAAAVSPELLARDAGTELLARGPRVRLTGEMLRDSLLQSSGLLSSKMYGPGVHPPQPQSVSMAAYGSPKWTPSTGEDRYRRSIYTFSKRTAPFAAFATFDAPSGELCIARRNRSNTPLQALTLLNDAMYLEMAAALAADVLAEQPVDATDAAILESLFRRLVTRPPRAEETAMIFAFHRTQRDRIATGELDPSAVLASDETADERHAAWTLVARALMNLDEVVTKP